MSEPLDIPQATLARVRAVVAAVAQGAESRDGIEQLSGIARRQVGYGLAAARVLGLVDIRRRDFFSLSEAGRQLAACAVGSNEEASFLRNQVEHSETIQKIAPDLFAEPGPSKEAIARRIAEQTTLSTNTAEHRAGMILRWRKQLLTNPDPKARKAREVGGRWRRIELHNYRSFDRLCIDLPPLCILEGANGSGKSALADACCFLAELACDPTRALSERGGWQAIARNGGALPVVLDVRAAATRQALDETYVRHRIALNGPQAWHISHELLELCNNGERVAWLERDGDAFTDSNGRGADGLSGRESIARRAHTVPSLARCSLLHQVAFPLLGIGSLRSQAFGGEHGLASRLRKLRKSRSFPGLVEAMRNVIAGLIDFHFIEGEGQEDVVYEQAQGVDSSAELSLACMSDGALRTLVLLLHMHELPAGSMLVVEHPEQQLADASQEVVVEAMLALSRRASVVVTTHAPQVFAQAESSSKIGCRLMAGCTVVTEHE
jgi:predicted ATPase